MSLNGYSVSLTMQGQCKPDAIELARIAEVQPVLADFIGKGRVFFNAPPRIPYVRKISVNSSVNLASVLRNFRKNGLNNDLPKLVAQLGLRVLLHVVVSLHSVLWCQQTAEVLGRMVADA